MFNQKFKNVHAGGGGLVSFLVKKIGAMYTSIIPSCQTHAQSTLAFG